MIKKYILDWQVVNTTLLNKNYLLLKLYLHNKSIPDSVPGQFVQIRIKNTRKFFLRRPISIHYIDKKNNELWLLIHLIGEGSRKLANLQSHELINIIFPLGNGFTLPNDTYPIKTPILIGGGIGIAPLLYLGASLRDKGIVPIFLLGAKTETDLCQLDQFKTVGQVYISTENGYLGERGFVSNHSILNNKTIDFIYSCGPKQMMKSILQYAKQRLIPCEVSLEKVMACGIGACLCCVEKTTKGNVCVCTKGPVFNIKELIW